MPGGEVHFCSTLLTGMRQADPQNSPASQSRWIHKLQIQQAILAPPKPPQHYSGQWLRNTPDINFCFSQAHLHMCTLTHTHTCVDTNMYMHIHLIHIYTEDIFFKVWSVLLQWMSNLLVHVRFLGISLNSNSGSVLRQTLKFCISNMLLGAARADLTHGQMQKRLEILP